MYTAPTSAKGKALNFFFVFLAALLAVVVALHFHKQTTDAKGDVKLALDIPGIGK